MERALITSASNKFFPSLLNFLGSLKANYPDHPKVYVYDLGLARIFKKELQTIENVELISMPRFCPFWRSCYTWKCYIFAHPVAELNLYLDAGCQILRPLDEIFESIKSDDYFSVSQGTGGGSDLIKITPKEYKFLFPVAETYYNKECITAGIFGFKADSLITPSLNELYEAAKAGLALGFSKSELWKNKGFNKNPFIRDCDMFRHDTTLLSLILRKNWGDFIIHDLDKYAGWRTPNDAEGQLIWNLRLNYKNLKYLRLSDLHKEFTPSAYVNRFIVMIMLILKNINRLIKNSN